MNSPYLLWGIVAAYVTFIFVKGVVKVKRIHNADDFLVAGRSVPWFLLFCTMGATVIGGGSSVGALGRTYDWGVLMLLVSSGWYLHFIFSGLVVAPRFREARLYTVAGYFGHRYGEGPRFFVMILSLLFSVFIIAAQMAAFGWVLSALVPAWSESAVALKGAILIGGALVVIYSTAGGLLAVIHTDVYQFVVLIVGLFITMLLCLPDVLAGWNSPEAMVPGNFYALEGGKGWAFAISTFLAFFLGETFAPGYATRYCVGEDVRQTKIGIAGVGVFLALVFPAILFFIALYARIHFPDIGDSQMALPLVVQALNNSIIAALIIGALLSAVMSSADSALNSSTAIFVKDLFEHQLGWEGGAKRTLLLARICSALLGVTAIGIALYRSNIIDLLLFTYWVWAPAIILPVVIGTMTKTRTRLLVRHILITMIAATAGTLAYRFVPGILDLGAALPGGAGESFAAMARSGFIETWRAWPDQFDPAVVGVFMSVVVYTVLRQVQRDRGQHIPFEPEEIAQEREDREDTEERPEPVPV